ncbi:hypothetical protein TSUD_131290 [Trifolium subterraneum]|uniref:Uncharacterized protein n=1 Tax=Trifolium subterraneum TaxID=3900 RepID=A0A2Z6NMA3_TRISU|nr:hypothetical protein TSUD_131290 [Trifolium subterraneum]
MVSYPNNINQQPLEQLKLQKLYIIKSPTIADELPDNVVLSYSNILRQSLLQQYELTIPDSPKLPPKPSTPEPEIVHVLISMFTIPFEHIKLFLTSPSPDLTLIGADILKRVKQLIYERYSCIDMQEDMISIIYTWIP